MKCPVVAFVVVIAATGGARAEEPAPEPPADEPAPGEPSAVPPPTEPVPVPPPAASGAPVAPVIAPPPSDGLTTDVFQEDPNLDLHWKLLNIPERVVELAFAPVGLLVAVVEEKRLDKRVKELISFWDGRIKLQPRFKLAFGDGLGLGILAKGKSKTTRRTESKLGFVYRLDGDYEIDGELEQPFGSLNDRVVRVNGDIEVDKNERFYGLGGGSTEDTRRVLRSDHQLVDVSMDLQPKDWYDYSGRAAIGLYRQTLAPGTSASTPAVGTMVDDPAGVPPGFGTTITYATAYLSGHYDTRDTFGRPSRGLVADVSADAKFGLQDADLAGIRFKASARWYLPILPEARTLSVAAGGSAALPLYPGATIPLETLALLGREQHLRGYDRARFRDKYAFWGAIEYRFPIYEYLNTDVGLDPYVFAEGGTTFGIDSLQVNRMRWSAGGGLRLAHETTLVIDSFLAYSPEGIQLIFGGEADF